MKSLTRSKMIQEIIKDVRSDMENEEIIHLVLEKTVSNQEEEKETFGQKLADSITKLAGSWGFIILFTSILIGWIICNLVLIYAFDPYPFILLNLFLSCVAAIQAPIIMMSQNRQDQKDRIRADNNYKVNLKTEIIIQDLHEKLDTILENQNYLMDQKKKSINKTSDRF